MSTIKISLVALLIALAGCDDKKAEAGEAAASEATPPAATSPAEDPKTVDGTKHDPPIALDKVPDGHWYCDMGTSHYSRAEKGDGKCPLCGMALKHMDHAKMGHGEHGGSDGHGDDHDHAVDHHHE